MGPAGAERRTWHVDKTRAEAEGLAERGVIMAGNAFSQVLLLKGTPGESDAHGLLSGADGTALRAALQALGYAPEDWVALATWDASGAPLDPQVLREALCALSPTTVVACDATAAEALDQAYVDDPELRDARGVAKIPVGTPCQVCGMRVLALDGFEAALATQRSKQLMWRRLKMIPPLGEPY